ncbi:ubiquitin-conjugating enzyme family protein [Capsaspora owczarzaki ATCC 30864]|uniref:Ubiquitin-conjugating enzyme family protein n=1 Tax=Capsaspora owczarzaki (strain ATCC 30864) TaxID=595528 RepID=A0A0D2UBN0_CAPO3|nr:ubiquitin-conjugating enzyme family protein [Capsaspora owczarzaki ATCC 30864]KJE92441.1 ubiquitin-conjugating enzyme family protein [Capsaspora owczarzaki ATCC 30864]|eukprot:XP_004364257.1 ubiquitin-conjugating enzyme family protein [Capsaspora owczarzaki ATCC 30864]
MAGTMGASAAVLRLLSDYKHVQADPPEGCSAAPVSEDNLFQWNAAVSGPEGTPWEGGIYNMHLAFSDNYPTKPPKIRFVSEMFHPNIYSDGSICLDIIQDKWSPIYTISSILTSIQSLLADPNINSPANPDAASLYSKDIKAYKRRVRQCAERSIN